MWRYLLIATAVVFLVGGIAAAFHFSHRELRVASVQSTGSPSPPRRQAPSTFTPGPVTGNAPWAFNTLMDCFRHERTFEGTLASARRHIPADAKRFSPDLVLESGECVAQVDSDDGPGRVRRGSREYPSVQVVVPAPLEIFVEGGPSDPADVGKRRIYVLRWRNPNDARVDRLSTMDFARVERIRI